MPKLPRDLSGRDLSKLLGRYGYEIVRETGSHIRLVSTHGRNEHRITIPDHQSIKVGTLDAILTDVSSYLQISKQDLLEQLFG